MDLRINMTPASTNTDTHALFKMMPRGFNKKKFSVSYQVVNNKNLQEIQNYSKQQRQVERMFDYEKDCCDDCLNCAYYWQNTDTENQCEGENEPCHEYIEFKGIGH